MGVLLHSSFEDNPEILSDSANHSLPLVLTHFVKVSKTLYLQPFPSHLPTARLLRPAEVWGCSASTAVVSTEPAGGQAGNQKAPS